MKLFLKTIILLCWFHSFILIAYDVAILGAGLAGLAAADYLVSRGYNVIILEAENRAGGRVYTHHRADGIHYEQGAFSFGNGEQPLWDYIQRFNLPIVEHTSIQKKFCFKEYVGNVSECGSFLKENEQEIPLYALLDYFLEKIEGIEHDISLSQALQKVGASNQAIEWLQAQTLWGLLGDFKVVSTKAAVAFLKQYDNSTSSYAFQGGNDLLPNAFAVELKERILFNHKVEKVEQRAGKCVLSGAQFTIEAGCVIFAVPLPQLGKIDISPSLSSKKQKIMNTVLYTPCASVSMVAPSHIFGSVLQAGVFLLSDQLGWFRDQSAFQINPDKKTVFNVHTAGAKAETLLADAELCKYRINEKLSYFFPDWDANKVEYYLHTIVQGYSCFPVGMYEKQDVLRMPEGKFYFAGEHTSSKFASMNGAIESGIRAAKEIIESETRIEL